MADFPESQDYYVFTSESIGTDEPVALTFVLDEGIVRTIPGKKTVWNLQAIDREKGIYTFKHIESGKYSSINSDGHSRHQEEPQEWKFGKTDNGYSVSRLFGDEEFFAHLDDEGKLTASPASTGRIQSWVFKPVNEY